MFDLLMDVNQLWAAKAGALVALVAARILKPTMSQRRRTALMPAALDEYGPASATYGIGSPCHVGISPRSSACRAQLKRSFCYSGLNCFGYPASADDLPEPLRSEKCRRRASRCLN